MNKSIHLTLELVEKFIPFSDSRPLETARVKMMDDPDIVEVIYDMNTEVVELVNKKGKVVETLTEASAVASHRKRERVKPVRKRVRKESLHDRAK